MDPISNVDRLVLLLRQRLQDRSRTAGAARPAARTATGEAPAAGLENLQALAAVEGIDERQFRRALIENILADQFGPDLRNEAKFQQVVDRVSETLENEPGAARLLERVVGDLRTAAR